VNEQSSQDCTCPSGDGSLHWPCPAHGPQRATGAINLIDELLRTRSLSTHVRARLRTVLGILDAIRINADRGVPFDLVAHLERQQRFSAHTFGPGARAAGIIDHIRKELQEIEADPADLAEWVDVIILAFDGAWRSGATPRGIIDAIVAKQSKNEGRIWPDWRTMPADKAIEHDRSADGDGKPASAQEASDA